MSESHVPAPGSRDPNDEKIMANSMKETGPTKGRTIEASNTTLNNYENSPIEAYYEFPQSNTKSFETYSKRMQMLSDVLGWRDSVKG